MGNLPAFRIGRLQQTHQRIQDATPKFGDRGRRFSALMLFRVRFSLSSHPGPEVFDRYGQGDELHAQPRYVAKAEGAVRWNRLAKLLLRHRPRDKREPAARHGCRVFTHAPVGELVSLLRYAARSLVEL